jgi:hypothetical protein
MDLASGKSLHGRNVRRRGDGVKVYTDPLLLDFIKVCARMPEDERRQLEAFTGHPYDIDGAAVGNFMAQGPKWVFKVDDEPIIVGGFTQQRPGVWRDFMLTTPEAWGKHWFSVTRMCRRIMDDMIHAPGVHRLECISHAKRAKAHDWYRVLSYNLEGTMYGYCADGSDAVLYSRVRH